MFSTDLNGDMSNPPAQNSCESVEISWVNLCYMDLLEVFKLRTIAVVGASRDPSKWAHVVPLYRKRAGYRIIPINTSAGEILEEKAYPTLHEVPDEINVVRYLGLLKRRPGLRKALLGAGGRGGYQGGLAGGQSSPPGVRGA